MDSLLCDELLQEIFPKLQPSSSSSVSLVSKRWLHLCHTAITNFSYHLLLLVSSFRSQLHSLRFLAGPVSLSSLNSIPPACTHLTSLGINLSRPFCPTWVLKFPSLKELSIWVCYEEGVEQANEVHMEYGLFPNEELDAELENCGSLMSLLVYDGGSREGLLMFFSESHCKLQKLDLRLPLDLNNDNLLAATVNFRSRSKFISMLVSCNYLVDLRLRGCKGSKSCKRLENVDIMNCGGIQAEAVEVFVLNSPQLRKVQVEESKLSDVAKSRASHKFVEVI
ncbi:hypothetical protein FNV43_RR14262 [Rhamnella rubrinervis]|uniref:F-box domain-containing protein n=1 Tax=Rhamnella rubrinervis TaxID=2594499 RepID=A0A8K0H2W8_9ROSA|nr:hypothetical protein FNV43_RR14262 [Rhamnella rubrinervis]